jgi:hypothetical protein
LEDELDDSLRGASRAVASLELVLVVIGGRCLAELAVSRDVSLFFVVITTLDVYEDTELGVGA